MYTTDLSLAQQALRQEDKHHIEHLAVALGLHYPTSTPVQMVDIADRLGRLHSDPVRVITVQQALLSWLGVKLVPTKKLHAVARAYWTAVAFTVWPLNTGGQATMRERVLGCLPGHKHPVDIPGLNAIIEDCARHIQASGLVVGHQHECPYWADQRLAEMARHLGNDQVAPDLAKLAILSTALIKRIPRTRVVAIQNALKEQVTGTQVRTITAAA